MNCSFFENRISASRALLARLVAVLLVLQAFIPGVLAYAAEDAGIWCLSLATGEQADHSTPVSHDACLVCTVMAAGNAPVPATPPAIRMVANVEMALLHSSVIAPLLTVSAGVSPPIRAPPSALSAAKPDCDAQGCALA